MFEQVFKSLDDIMFQEPGCNSELYYAKQSSWMLFLKYRYDIRHSSSRPSTVRSRLPSPVSLA